MDRISLHTYLLSELRLGDRCDLPSAPYSEDQLESEEEFKILPGGRPTIAELDEFLLCMLEHAERYYLLFRGVNRVSRNKDGRSVSVIGEKAILSVTFTSFPGENYIKVRITKV